MNMEISTIALLISFLFSFFGLCILAIRWLQVDLYISPAFVACAVISLLMTFGMLGALSVTFVAIYSLGVIGLVVGFAELAVKKKNDQIKSLSGLFLLLFVFSAFLVWRFYDCPLANNDDPSHWAIIARHLLRYDNFPSNEDLYIVFRSYPLGSACFIYYFSRFVENSEGLYLIAQNFLIGICFLPILSNIKTHKKVLYPFCGFVFFYFFHFFRYLITLQVDTLLALMGIAMVAAAFYYKNDYKKSLLIVVPMSIAVTFVKSSGIYFAVVAFLTILFFSNIRSKNKKWYTYLLFLLPLLAFAIWQIYTNLTYTQLESTKHAVSAQGYLSSASQRGISVLFQILIKMVKETFNFRGSISACTSFAFILVSVVLLYVNIKKIPQNVEEKLILKKWIAFSVIAYAIWYAVTLFAYFVSFPLEEALGAASFYRYNGTGLAFFMGMLTIAIVLSIQELEFKLENHIIQKGSYIALIIAFALYVAQSNAVLPTRFVKETEYSKLRSELICVHTEYDLKERNAYLFVQSETHYNNFINTARYEFESAEIYQVAILNDCEYMVGSCLSEAEIVNDATEFILEATQKCDAIILYDENEQIEAVIDKIEGVKIIKAY